MPLNELVAANSRKTTVQAHAQRLYRRIALITKNREDAEDALQDTFLRAYVAIGTFEGRSSVYSWLTRIAINSALMVLRRRRARAEVFCDLAYGDREGTVEMRDDAPDPEQLYAGRQLRVRLFSAIQNLDPKLREPLEIHVKHDCSMNEIAEALDISMGALKARLHRARRRLAASKGLRHPGNRGKASEVIGCRPCSSDSSVEGRHG